MSRPAAVLVVALSLAMTVVLAGTAAAQTPARAPAPAAPAAPADPFGEPVTLPAQTIVFVSGQANWDSAFETLVEAFKRLNAYLDQHKIAPSGPAMTVYTQTDDTGFSFQAALPVAAPPAEPPPAGIAVGTSPGGQALKFVHRGSYDTLDATYEAITNELDRKGLDAKDMFIEEYVSDLLKTAEDRLVVNIYVPIRTP